MPEPVKPADNPATDDFDYEAEFNAMVAKREGTEPAPAAEPAPAEPAPEAATASEPAADPAPAAEAEPAPEAEPEAAPEQAPEDAELADLPPAVKAKIVARLEAAKAAEEKAKKLENDNRSMAGRMSAYQRRYEEAVGKRQPEAAPQPTAEQSAEWTQFVKDYPDIAKAIEAKFQTAQAAAPEGSEPIKDVVQYVQEQKRRQFLEDSWAVIDTVHPTWREDVKTKEFQEWKASSPAYEKLAASDDIADAVALFDLYSLVRPKQVATSKPADPKAAQVAARREAQAEGARAPASKSAAPNQSLDMADEDQLFAFYAKQADERSRRRSI